MKFHFTETSDVSGTLNSIFKLHDEKNSFGKFILGGDHHPETKSEKSSNINNTHQFFKVLLLLFRYKNDQEFDNNLQNLNVIQLFWRLREAVRQKVISS